MLRWTKVGTILLVGLSSGLVAVHGDAPLESVLLAIGGGSLVGTALVWYLFPGVDAIAPASSHRYRRK